MRGSGKLSYDVMNPDLTFFLETMDAMPLLEKGKGAPGVVSVHSEFDNKQQNEQMSRETSIF